MLSLNAIPALLALAGAFVSQASAECNASVHKLEGYGSGTTGGGNAAPVDVRSCAELEAATASKGSVIRVFGQLRGCGVIDLKDDTTLIGGDYQAFITNGVVRIKDARNVIVRNMGFAWPLEGQASLALDGATQVWIDHNDFNMGMGKYEDDYGAELEISSSDLVTVSWNLLMQTWKGSVVRGNAGNSLEEYEQPRVTYHHNFFFDLQSRAPAISATTSHVYSNCFDLIHDFGLSASNGAKVLVENNSFGGANRAIVTDLNPESEGSVTERNNEFYGSPVQITKTGHVEPSYEYSLDSASCICDYVCSNSGKML